MATATTTTIARPTQRAWDRARAASIAAMQQSLRDAGYAPDAGTTRLMAMQVMQQGMTPDQRAQLAIAVRRIVGDADLQRG